MNSRHLFLKEIIPKIQRYYAASDVPTVGSGEARYLMLDLCNAIQNIFDYLIADCPEYVQREWGAKSKSRFLEVLDGVSGELIGEPILNDLFGFIRDVANVSKHSSISRANAIVKTSKNIIECLGVIRYQDGDGYYFGYKAFVVARTTKNVPMPIDLYIGYACKFIERMLIDAGVIPKEPGIIDYVRDFHMTRREVQMQASPKVLGKKGEYMNVLFQNYVYESGGMQIRTRRPGDFYMDSHKIECIIDDAIFK